jgi:hypothetical protein
MVLIPLCHQAQEGDLANFPPVCIHWKLIMQERLVEPLAILFLSKIEYIREYIFFN